MTNMSAKTINTITPAGFTLVNDKALTNPENPSAIGALCRNNVTGIYVLFSAGSMLSCPQAWAKRNDTTISK